MLFKRKKFFDQYGNFDGELFLELIKKSNKKIKKGVTNNSSFDFSFGGFFSSISKKDVWKFINKLSGFLGSGIDVKTSLSIITKEINNPYFSKIISEMKDNIDFGILVSDTMKQYPKVFDNLTVSLISIGEKTGNLGNILRRIDQKMLEQIELKSKVKGALIYPVILLSLTVAMVVFMMVFIIPKITETFQKTGVDLPRLTNFVIGVSNFLQEKWHILLFGFIIFIIFINFFKKTVIGELIFGGIGIKIPIFSYMIKKSNIIYFSNAFTLLLDSGVLMIEALELARKVSPNIHYRREIIRVKREVESGVSFSKSLGLNTDNSSGIYLNKLFDEEFAYIVNMGEQTGTLSKSIYRLRENYNSELKRYIGNLSTMLEPFILVIVGILVGTIVIAIMLPFFNIGKTIK